ncbi:MAG: hypothetical protein ACUVTO_02590 [Candidatus Caldatribacteriaceae bacterium]
MKRWGLLMICTVCLVFYFPESILNAQVAPADTLSSQLVEENPQPVYRHSAGSQKGETVLTPFEPQAIGRARLQMSTPTSSPAVTAKQPKTGTIVKDTRTIRGGWGSLTIENGFQYDVVVFLTHYEGKKALYAVYIRANDKFTIPEIPEGVYNLYFVIGENWDRKEKAFQRVIARKRLRSPLEFWMQSYRMGKRAKYNSISVTLHPAALPLFTEEVGEQYFPGLG